MSNEALHALIELLNPPPERDPAAWDALLAEVDADGAAYE